MLFRSSHLVAPTPPTPPVAPTPPAPPVPPLPGTSAGAKLEAELAAANADIAAANADIAAAGAAIGETVADPAEDARLEILRALERGEIGIDEATKRLAELDGQSDV